VWEDAFPREGKAFATCCIGPRNVSRFKSHHEAPEILTKNLYIPLHFHQFLPNIAKRPPKSPFPSPKSKKARPLLVKNNIFCTFARNFGSTDTIN